MLRVLRFLASFTSLSLLAWLFFFPSGCASSASPISFSEDDASAGTGGRDGAAGDGAGATDGPASSGGCQSNGDCATSTKGHVCVSGTCQVCAANADCPTGQKCDAHTSCVACLTSADCGADQRCVNNACAMGCDATSTCPTSTVCDTTTSACVGCLQNTDCTAPTAKCMTTGNTCVACLATSDCAAGTVCAANACVPGCTSAQPCPTGQVCNSGLCVQCTVNSQCHGATPWCDTTSDKCVQCLPSNDSCPAGEYCAGTACAPGCKSNLDCTALADAGAGDAASDAAGDAATDAGGGTGSGTTCDTTNHVCVGCLVDSNCPLGQTCSNQTCVAGCDATHGCPAGSGCCTGLCQPLNTVSNCTGCGITCDTTSGNSQGAACGPGGCTYTGCAAGWGDCTSAAPDSDGCETSLTTTNEKACADGTCVPKATCCSASDCSTPPTPTSCYPATGVCASEGATCSYALNAGSVVCTGTTCCNAINGSCNNDCSLTCAPGFGHCVGDPSKGCETSTDANTADCGGCARACSGSHTTALSCSSGACNSTCATGWGNCSTPLAPAADDGCESNLTTCYGTPCCTAGDCADPHPNGAGENYDDCDPLGTPGTASTYTQTMAEEAAAVYTFTNPTYYVVTCNGGETAIDICNAAGTKCYASWCYTGACAGYLLVEAGGIAAYCPAGVTATSWK